MIHGQNLVHNLLKFALVRIGKNAKLLWSQHSGHGAQIFEHGALVTDENQVFFVGACLLKGIDKIQSRNIHRNKWHMHQRLYGYGRLPD